MKVAKMKRRKYDTDVEYIMKGLFCCRPNHRISTYQVKFLLSYPQPRKKLLQNLPINRREKKMSEVKELHISCLQLQRRDNNSNNL